MMPPYGVADETPVHVHVGPEEPPRGPPRPTPEDPGIDVDEEAVTVTVSPPSEAETPAYAAVAASVAAAMTPAATPPRRLKFLLTFIACAVSESLQLRLGASIPTGRPPLRAVCRPSASRRRFGNSGVVPPDVVNSSQFPISSLLRFSGPSLVTRRRCTSHLPNTWRDTLLECVGGPTRHRRRGTRVADAAQGSPTRRSRGCGSARGQARVASGRRGRVRLVRARQLKLSLSNSQKDRSEAIFEPSSVTV